MPPLIAPEKTAGTTPVGQQPAQPPKGQGKKGNKAKDGQTQKGGMWTGNGSTAQTQLKTTVTPSDIRALEGQFTHKWVARYIAALVNADLILARQFGNPSSKEEKLEEYRTFLSSKLTGDEKQSLNTANQGPNSSTAIHVCSGLAMSGMIKPVTLKVFFPKADSSDIALINDVRKVTGLGRVDQAQLESEGARS